MLYNQSGQLVYDKQYIANDGINEINISKDSYHTGIYYLQLINSKKSISSKIFFK